MVLVIHAGGDDLCQMRLADLLVLMRADFERIMGYFNNMILVLSEIIPRAVWQGARDAIVIERSRRALNTRVSRLIRAWSGEVVRHMQLEGDNRALTRRDGVQLSDIGLDIFLSGLQDGVE